MFIDFTRGEIMHVLATRIVIAAFFSGVTLMASVKPTFANDLYFIAKFDDSDKRDEFRNQLSLRTLMIDKQEICRPIDDRKILAPTVTEKPLRKSKHFGDSKFEKVKFQLGIKCTPVESNASFRSSALMKIFTDALLYVRNVKGDRDATITIMAPSGRCIALDCEGLGYPQLRDIDCIPC